jgi:hypothetical protein
MSCPLEKRPSRHGLLTLTKTAFSESGKVQLGAGFEVAYLASMSEETPGKPLSPAAKRALEEAAARRAVEAAPAKSDEQGGPAGPEPTRFGDWERKGIAVDF